MPFEQTGRDADGSVAEQQRILMDFVAAADPRREKLVFHSQPWLSNPNALRLMERIAETAEQRGSHDMAAVIRQKRQRLMQMQGGF